MKTKNIIRLAGIAILALGSVLLSSCAAVGNTSARHDYDGDGLVSHAEYQQANARYNLDSRARVDEALRARLVTRHVFNARDAIAGASDAANLLRNFGH